MVTRIFFRYFAPVPILLRLLAASTPFTPRYRLRFNQLLDVMMWIQNVTPTSVVLTAHHAEIISPILIMRERNT